MKLDRRRFLIGSAVAAIAASAKGTLPLAESREHNSPQVSGNPLKIPPVISGGTLNVAPANTQVMTGAATRVLAINNTFPAPTIRVRKGDTFNAHIVNNLTDDVVLHWHGQHVPAIMDGHPKYAIAPGASTDITFPVVNRAGTYFYHAHTDMMTAEQVYRGLTGMFIVDDDEDGALQLPRGEFDVPLMLTDKRFDANNQLVYSPTDTETMTSGYLGETILVNGTPQAYFTVAPTIYRFRILNASNARVYQIALSDGSAFTIIGSDGGLLAAAQSVTSCYLSSAERVDILIDFSKYKSGSSLTVKSLSFEYDGTPYTPLPQGAEFDIIRFDITGTGNSNAVIPTTLSSITAYDPSQAAADHTFILSSNGMDHTIDGQSFTMDGIGYTIPQGRLEKWTFDNSFTTEIHPMHVHATQFQVIDRDGGQPLLPNDLGWKDTVIVRGGENVTVLVKFAEYTGTYLVHCHNLEHEDHGMMMNIAVSSMNAVASAREPLESLRVTPDPARNMITIYLPSDAIISEIKILDLHANTVLHKAVASGSQTATISVASLASGKYLIHAGDHVTSLVVTH